jgi:hypothetical protein
MSGSEPFPEADEPEEPEPSEDPCSFPLRVTIDGVTYDTDEATKLCHFPTPSSDQQLFQTECGDFFLLVLRLRVDGKQLGPHERWIDLGKGRNDHSRLSVSARILPLTPKAALEWCIKTQVPAPLRGYLLDCL